MILTFITLCIAIAGYIIGLGAVTVIDLHGLLGRHSPYWTEATTRTHKVTKPMIWIGMLGALGGGLGWYALQGDRTGLLLHLAFFIILIFNGCFLSFVVSPFLLAREREGKSAELLPAGFQHKIAASFVVSVLFWWGSLAMLLWSVASIISRAV